MTRIPYTAPVESAIRRDGTRAWTGTVATPSSTYTATLYRRHNRKEPAYTFTLEAPDATLRVYHAFRSSKRDGWWHIAGRLYPDLPYAARMIAATL